MANVKLIIALSLLLGTVLHTFVVDIAFSDIYTTELGDYFFDNKNDLRSVKPSPKGYTVRLVLPNGQERKIKVGKGLEEVTMEIYKQSILHNKTGKLTISNVKIDVSGHVHHKPFILHTSIEATNVGYNVSDAFIEKGIYNLIERRISRLLSPKL